MVLSRFQSSRHQLVAAAFPFNMCPKIDQFAGTQEQYIRFLEQIVVSLRHHHQACSLSSLQIPVRSPVPSGRSCAEVPRAPTPNASQSILPQYGYELEIIPWNPQPTEPKRLKANPPGWKKNAKLLVEITPKAENWWQTIRDLGIYETMCNGNAAAYMLDGNCETPTATTPLIAVTKVDSILLNHITAYAHAAMRRGVTASLAIMHANFQKFVVLSSCAVCCATGTPKERVLEIVKICMGNVSDDYCWRILRTAVYLNESIDILNANGWGDHGSELLLICEHLHPFLSKR